MNILKITNGRNQAIGVIAPSSPVPKGLIKTVAEYLRQQGILIKLGKNIGSRELFAAGTDSERAADIIRKNPKPIIGYSDATALQLGIYSNCRLDIHFNNGVSPNA